MTTEEQALRAALSDVAAGQPAAPHDRIDGVRRRHAQRRQRQMAGLAAAAVIAVVGAALAVVGVRGGAQGATVPAANRHLPSWALSWPDVRDPSIPQGVLDSAVEAWGHAAGLETGMTVTPQKTIWYRATKVADGAEIVVMFEVTSALYPNQLVVGYADTGEVIDGQPGYTNDGSPWTLSTVNSPKPSRHLVFGLNVHGAGGAASDNVAVVMADPHARSVAWHVAGADGRVHRATASMDGGFATIDAGQIRSRVRIDAVRDGHGNVLAGGVDVGVPGAASSYVVQLAPVPEFTDVPNTPSSLGESAAQGNLTYSTQDDTLPLHGTTIYARCYGGKSIVVGIDADSPGHRVVIPCDDREHVVAGPPLLKHSQLAPEIDGSNGNVVSTQIHAYDVSASDDIAWRVAVVAR